MGKGITETKLRDRDGETKVLFKKSNATIFTHSRTCSGASQLIFSKSGILQLRKNLENQNNYYLDRGKLKRDLSLETDICILRRYYRTKRNKLSSNLDSSAKSKYSTVVDTEVETIEEYPDTSACGDNETAEIKSNLPLDIASLMIDNLKDLLNQWIQKHLLENKSTKQKINTVLDTLIQKLDERKGKDWMKTESSSGSTYVLQREATNQAVKNKKVETTSLMCQYCRHKARNLKRTSSSNISRNRNSSVLTLPFHYKDIRIISTLSIPRSFHKRGGMDDKNQNNSWYKIKKIKHKNIILSIDRSNKVINSSSFDLVAISTKSLSSKRCTNYDVTNVNKKKRHIVFFPKPSYKSATDTNSSTTNNDSIKINNIELNKHQLDDMPSLLKSLYANDLEIITSADKNIQYDTKTDIFTMTDSLSKDLLRTKSKLIDSQSKDMFKQETMENNTQENDQYNATVINYIDETTKTPSICVAENDVKSDRNLQNKFKKTPYRGKINKRRRNYNRMLTNFKPTKYQNIQSKQFTFLYKKANDHKSQGKDFLKHCQNILHYFAEYDGNKNIKLDVRINVFPMYENRTKDVCTDISKSTFDNYDRGTTLLYNVQPAEISTPVENYEESLKDPLENENSSSTYTPEIIPILDGAVSQDKYFHADSREKVTEISKQNSLIARSTLTHELEIVQEISELRAVIKDLAAAAEKFVSEHLRKEYSKSAETNISRTTSQNFTSSSKCEVVINLKNPSKAVQYSKDFSHSQKQQSGLKISKEPKKKDTFEYYNRLTKKSTSYRIIDSESILKVTDMTSKANEFNENRVIDQALTCSLPKSRSLFEMTSDQRNNQKFIALFCDNYQKNVCVSHICDVCRNSSTPYDAGSNKSAKCRKWCKIPWGRNMKRDCGSTPPPPPPPPLPRQSCCCQSGSRSGESCNVPIVPDTTDGGYSSTVCFPGEEEGEEEEDNVETELRKCCKERRGMGFGEGCVYCLLLWIPVLIIACLFYGYVLKDQVKFPDSKKAVGRSDLKPLPPRNTSVLFVKLSDLGF